MLVLYVQGRHRDTGTQSFSHNRLACACVLRALDVDILLCYALINILSLPFQGVSASHHSCDTRLGPHACVIDSHHACVLHTPPNTPNRTHTLLLHDGSRTCILALPLPAAATTSATTFATFASASTLDADVRAPRRFELRERVQIRIAHDAATVLKRNETRVAARRRLRCFFHCCTQPLRLAPTDEGADNDRRAAERAELIFRTAQRLHAPPFESDNAVADVAPELPIRFTAFAEQ